MGRADLRGNTADRYVRFAFGLAPVVALYLAATGVASSLSVLRGNFFDPAFPPGLVIVSIVSTLFMSVLMGLVVLAAGDMVLSALRIVKVRTRPADPVDPPDAGDPPSGLTGRILTHLDRSLKMFGLVLAALSVLQFGLIILQIGAQAHSSALDQIARLQYVSVLLGVPGTAVRGLAVFGLGESVALLRKARKQDLRGFPQTGTL